jgi:hypothetical protein
LTWPLCGTQGKQIHEKACSRKFHVRLSLSFVLNITYIYHLYVIDGWLDADMLGCFMFLEAATDLFWVEAQQKCESIGGYLAEPSTARY